MAHFAEIVNDVVTRVVVTSNDWTPEATLVWLNDNVSVNEWVQTSYNSNIRGKYAGIGDIYDRVNDVFVGQEVTGNPEPEEEPEPE